MCLSAREIFGDADLLLAKVELGMGITDANIPFCHGISEENRDKRITLRYYNGRKLF